MAVNYSANQYENAFVSKRLQSWEVPKSTGARPGVTKAVTRPVATDDGHLLPAYRRDNSAWTGFVGTWDMPRKLPGNNIDNPTARHPKAYEKLRRDYEESKMQLTGQQFNYRAPRTTSYGTSKSLRPSSGQDDFGHPPRDADLEGGYRTGDSALGLPPGGEDSARMGFEQGEEGAYLSERIPVPDFSEEYEERYLAGL